jgi:hypothetical protein
MIVTLMRILGGVVITALHVPRDIVDDDDCFSGASSSAPIENEKLM